jgi:hypothetical protein
MRRLVVVVLVMLLACCADSLRASDRKLGKLFVKAAPTAVGEQQFTDPALEDTVRDMKRSPGKFIVAATEADADFLLVILERKVAIGQKLLTKTVNQNYIYATLSVKDGGNWRPGIKVSNDGDRNWRVAAESVLKRSLIGWRIDGSDCTYVHRLQPGAIHPYRRLSIQRRRREDGKHDGSRSIARHS